MLHFASYVGYIILYIEENIYYGYIFYRPGSDMNSDVMLITNTAVTTYTICSCKRDCKPGNLANAPHGTFTKSFIVAHTTGHTINII